MYPFTLIYMDIISHGLYGGGLFARDAKQRKRNKKLFWAAFCFGIFPDFLAFSWPFAYRIISSLSGNGSEAGFSGGYPVFPDYIHTLYIFGHSLVVFAVVFTLVSLILKKPYIPMLAWGFHVFLDIFTHSKAFFPTPFLWPISNYQFDGIPWGTPVIFLTNIVILVVLYTYLYIKDKKKWP